MNAMHAKAKYLHTDLSKFDDYLTESTYVIFDDSMLTWSLLVDHLAHIRVVLDHNHSGYNTNTAQYYCSRNWSRTIYVCQMTEKDNFGIKCVIVAGFNSNKRYTKLLFLTWTIICHCKEFWKTVISKVSPFYSIIGKVVFFMILW